MHIFKLTSGELQIDLGSEMSVKPMVIHRANPADQINAARGIPSSLSLNSISGSVSGVCAYNDETENKVMQHLNELIS